MLLRCWKTKFIQKGIYNLEQNSKHIHSSFKINLAEYSVTAVGYEILQTSLLIVFELWYGLMAESWNFSLNIRSSTEMGF